MHSETPDSKQSTPSLLMLLKETDSHAKWSTALLVSIPFFILIWYIHSIHLQDSPLVSGTHSDPNQQHRCKALQPKPPHPWCSLSSICTPILWLRFLSVIIIPRHQPFISPLQNYLAKLLAQRKNFNNQSNSAKKNQTSTTLSVSHLHLHARSIRLDLPCYQPTTTFCPFPALVPSTSPHQYSSIPHHHLRRLLPALHNTPTKRKASPCIICSSNGEILVAKMMANKTKSKPQKHVVFTPVRWPIVWSHKVYTNSNSSILKAFFPLAAWCIHTLKSDGTYLESSLHI